MTTNKTDILSFEGCSFLRQRLILATLSCKDVRIKNIRHRLEDPGIRDFEANFLQLLEKISNGCLIEVSETGTSVFYRPGLLHGGKFEHNCCTQRSIGYYLESIICLAPFCKKPLEITLTGVTNDRKDPSIDAIKLTTVPLLKRFLGTDEGLSLQINRRGVPPEGGGQITFTCPVRQKLRTINLLNQGKIKRIRGVAYAVRVSPAMANRLVEAAKGILLKYLPDIYIYTDSNKGANAGRSPGFGLCLVAESTEGIFYSSEVISNMAGEEPSVPEDLAVEAAHGLLEEVYKGGCVDSINQSLACLFMAFGPPDVSKIKSGSLTPYTIQFLRHLRDFTSVMFKLELENRAQDDLKMGGDKVVLTCLGMGYSNLNKTNR